MTSENQTIFRRAKDRENPYVMVDRTVFENPALSWKAKGLLGYLLSRPDDWTVRMGDLIKRSTDGRTAVRAAVDELIAAGHMVREKTQNERGRFEWVIEVHEVPVITRGQNLPMVDGTMGQNPSTVNPLTENLPSTNIDLPSTEGSKATTPPKPQAEKTKAASDDCVIDFREYPFAEPGQTVIEDGIVIWRIDLGDTGERICPKCGKEYTVTSLQASRAVCPGKACGMGIRAYLGDETTARWRPPQKLRPRRVPVTIPYRAAVGAFCELANLDIGRLGGPTCAQWGNILQASALDAGADETETVEAIGRIESHTEGWPSNPFQMSFKNELAAQLARAPTEEITYTPEMIAIIQAGAANDGY